MNNENTVSSEERTKNMLFSMKRNKPKIPEMSFISPEEGALLTKMDDDTKKKRPKPSKGPTELVLDEVNPEWKKAKKDIREISTVLASADFAKSKNIKVKGPQITPMMVEFFHEYLDKHPSIKRIAVIGFNSGYTTETFLTARSDIEVVAFDPLKLPYVGICASYISEHYHKRFMLIGGTVCDTIEFFATYLGQKRYDMIYIDSGSYPQTAKADLNASIYLAHSKSVVFMENVKPYSKTGVDAFNAWDGLVQRGGIRESANPYTWEELNRCVCEGLFVAGSDCKPLRAGELSRVRTFWETDPSGVLWKYGTELHVASPEQAMEIWETMVKNDIKYDQTALNMYITALQKGTDRKYLQEVERAKKLLKSL